MALSNVLKRHISKNRQRDDKHVEDKSASSYPALDRASSTLDPHEKTEPQPQREPQSSAKATAAFPYPAADPASSRFDPHETSVDCSQHEPSLQTAKPATEYPPVYREESRHDSRTRLDEALNRTGGYRDPTLLQSDSEDAVSCFTDCPSESDAEHKKSANVTHLHSECVGGGGEAQGQRENSYQDENAPAAANATLTTPGQTSFCNPPARALLTPEQRGKLKKFYAEEMHGYGGIEPETLLQQYIIERSQSNNVYHEKPLNQDLAGEHQHFIWESSVRALKNEVDLYSFSDHQ